MAKRIRKIISENPYQKMWDTYVYFESEPTTKAFLEEVYEKREVTESKRLAFQNTPKFIYFIKQAREYFHTAKQSHILVKPLLVYYGMMSLVKAVVLTMDPTYPSTTSVLRHGITTRKIKKLDYVFHEDEIKIQKEGLVPLFYELLTNNDHWPQNKYRVKDLLALVPELHESFYRLYGTSFIEPLFIAGKKDEETGNTLVYVAEGILDMAQGDPNQWLNRINQWNRGESRLVSVEPSSSALLELHWQHPSRTHVYDCADGFNNPLFLQDFKGRYYIYRSFDTLEPLPEVLIQYLLMYNLGMLCRYETELWGEIIFSFSSGDMYMINELINITMRKFPNLILNLLFDEVLIFNHI